MERFSILGSVADIMTIVGGFVLILILLVILHSVHKQAKRIQELQTEIELSETKEQALLEEESNG